MGRPEALDSGHRRNETYHPDVVRAAFLQPDYSSGGRVSGCQHRHDNNDQALRKISGRLEEIFDGGERFRLAIKTDMRDARCRDQVEHAFGNADTRAQDRCDHKLFARYALGRGARKRGFDLGIDQRKVAGDFITQEHADLAQQLAKCLRRALLVSNERELVLNEWMVSDVDSLHWKLPSLSQNILPSLMTRMGGDPSERSLAASDR